MYETSGYGILESNPNDVYTRCLLRNSTRRDGEGTLRMDGGSKRRVVARYGEESEAGEEGGSEVGRSEDRPFDAGAAIEFQYFKTIQVWSKM